MECVAIVGGSEVTLLPAPVTYALRHALYELTHAGFALRRVQCSMKILAGHNVDGGHRPVFWRLNATLLKDAVALCVRNAGGAPLPFHLVVRRGAGAGGIT